MRWLAVLGAAALAAAACQSSTPRAPREPRTVGAPRAGESAEAEGSLGPARWRYHPTELGPIRDGARLPDGSWLLGGARGVRWLARPLSTRDAPEQAPAEPARVYLCEAAATRMAEAIVALTRFAEGQWLFVGEGGTLGVAPSPLGPLTPMRRPSGELARVAGGAHGLVGLALDGALFRYAEPAGWSRVAPRVRMFDVASTAEGELLGLAIPEALLGSSDGGATWQPVDGAHPIGVQRLRPSAAGGVIVEGVSSLGYWTGRQPLRQAAGEKPLELPVGGGPILAPRRGPRAPALDERQAALVGKRYYEAFESEGEPLGAALGATTRPGEPKAEPSAGAEVTARAPSRWLWAAGTLDGPLEIHPLGVAEPCDSVRLGASKRMVVLGCIHFDRQKQDVVVELHQSRDGGTSFSPLTTLETPDTKLVYLAVGEDDTVLVAGSCVRSDVPCSPRAPLRISGLGSNAAEATSAGDLVDSAQSPAFSLDGTHAYFLGHRDKDQQLALYVSHDGGRSFASSPIAAGKRADELEQSPSWDPTGPSPVRSLHPGPDGRLGIVLQQEPPVYAVADADGRVLHLAKMPEGAMVASGAGELVLALGTSPSSFETVARSRDADGGRSPSGERPEPSAVPVPPRPTVWESVDGGLGFHEVASEPSLRAEDLGELAVFCQVGGCVLGTELSRIGWGQPDEPLPATTATAADASPELASGVLAPLECSLDDAAGWVTLSDVHALDDSVLPGVSQAMRGSSAWSALRFVDATGELVSVSTPLDGAPTTRDEQRLFAPVRTRDGWAYEVAHQLEGYAAARVALPKAGPTPGAPMGAIELSWIDYLHGRASRATIQPGTSFGPDSVTPPPRPALLTSLLSVSAKGLFVRPAAGADTTLLVDRRGRASAPLGYPSWPAVLGGLAQRSDAVTADDRPFALAWLRNEERPLAALGLAPMDTPGVEPSFVTLAPPGRDARQTVASLSYQGERVGVTVHVAVPSEPAAWASFFALGRDGKLAAPVALPTQLGLGTTPRGCSAEERRSTPRLVAPSLPGSRHPVLVRSSGEGLVLLTDWAVLHGTEAAPCLAAWGAHGVEPARGGSSAIIVGDPSHAWLFRPTPGRARALDVRPMACKYSPSSVVPKEIWSALGSP
jgi:hypothetical protein